MSKSFRCRLRPHEATAMIFKSSMRPLPECVEVKKTQEPNGMDVKNSTTYYLKTLKGPKIRIYDGYYLVKSDNGNWYAYTPATFNNLYEEIDENRERMLIEMMKNNNLGIPNSNDIARDYYGSF